MVSIGTLNSSFVSGRELFKSAILSNAASMILLHNHPSSELQMSQSDRMVTEKMMYASLFFRYRDFRPHHCSRKNRGHTEHKRNLPGDI
ncbi:MAG: JAB domain-containing protein [Clostridium sp.]